ncbi:TonB-dependent receptor [Chitinophaga sp. Cy-1792]|uniref:SusC/RagA family TonB-linked outer membrane protein n=1 Tax=Chitinophaga sp. Cy-1792 TaxID=2608339 RepID=UPI00142252B2|nr:TonB-dependent receptor [Chitinophaga sp. Cy-1792]NIG56354.1 TonB-dependent receptor [Chitinophaga sp. Cy-1792]
MLQRLLLVLVLLGPLLGFAQIRTVTGTVYSARENQPLPGATIVVAGTTQGVTSAADGTFKIEISNPAATKLIVSYIGMKQQEVAITTTPIRIALESGGKDIDEVVVIAYGTGKKNSLTGSVAQIKGADLADRQISSVSRGLQGQVAGVQSTAQSGQPGTDATIRIRGIGSINASADPLYVVDGAPYSGSINAINPSDIESISVLKDAASSALYGSRGANGVIIITTKKGKGKGNIGVRVAQGFSKRAVKDYAQVSTDDYFRLYWEALRNTNVTNGMTAAQAAASASGNVVGDLGINPYGTAIDEPVGTDGKLVAGAHPLWNDNWDKAMQQTGQHTQADLNISGSSEKSRYYISGSYLNDQGIYLASGFKRYNVRANIEADAKKWLTVGLNLSGAHSEQQAPPSDDSRSDNYVNYGRLMPSFYPIYERDPATGAYILDAKGNRIFDYGDYRPSANNPNTNLVQTAGIDLHNVMRDDVSARTFGQATIWDALKFKTTFSVDYSQLMNHDYTNPTLGFDAPIGGTVDRGSFRTFSWTWNNIFTYEKTFNQIHHINLLAGQEAYKYNYTFIDGNRSGFSLPGLTEPADAAVLLGYTGFSDNYTLSSYLSRAEYDYKNKYFFSASLRRDGSSRFSPDKRWGTFWSLGASWKMNEESWLKEKDWLDALTLRASYGAQGNDNLGTFYTYQSLYVVNSNLGEGGTYRDTLSNPNLKWETNLNLNVGVDWSMFDNRFGGTVEFFQRKSQDLLFALPKAPSTGYASISQNIGAMRNNGIDVTLRGVPVKTKDFSWTVNLNMTHYNNKVTSLPQKEIISGTKKLMVGKSIYEFYLRDWAGVDAKTGAPLWYVTDPTTGAKTTTSNYSAGTLYYSGSALPDVYGGLTNTFTYKNFAFSFLWAYSLGGKVLDNDYVYLMHTGNNPGRSWSSEILNRWTPDNTNTNVPALTTNNTNWTSNSTRWLYDAAYARLKNVNLSYSFPATLMDKAHLHGLTIYVQGENLLTIYGHKGMDPEQNVNGVTYYRYPALKSLSAGINLNF